MNNTIICNNKYRLLLQLHVTGRCNQHCKHCYHTDYKNEPLSLNDIKNIVNEYIDLLKEYNLKKGIQCRGHINVTGGEPFVRSDFLDILKIFYDNRKYFSYGILTNGSYINDDIAMKLKKLRASFVQVSIDGNEEIHDDIRGKNNYKNTFKAIDILNKYKIRNMVSFTAHKMNYKCFSKVAKECRKHHIPKLWSDRLVPIGHGGSDDVNCLSKEECIEYFNIMKKERSRKIINKIYGINIEMKRSLQFLVTGESIYSCSAGDSLIVINELGDILPCRRMPIVCGNVLKDNLKDVYFNNDTMNDLRKRDICKGCENCKFEMFCKGGSKCIAYAINGDYKTADPFCPLLN